MRKATLILVLFLALIFPLSSFGWSGQWSNLYPFGGCHCAPISPGSLIQLIHAGPNGVIDDPLDAILGGTVNLRDWLAAGCPPVGDDTLIDQTVFLDYGPGPSGYFSKNISGIDSQQGDPWYTRFFTAPEYHVALGDGWGTVGDPESPDDPIYELVLTGWDGANYAFGDYIIRLEGVCADVLMIPEAATTLIGGVALLLGFFRRGE